MSLQVQEEEKPLPKYCITEDGQIFVATHNLMKIKTMRGMSEDEYERRKAGKAEPKKAVVVDKPKPLGRKAKLAAKIKELSKLELDPDDYSEKELTQELKTLEAEKKADASNNSDSSTS